MTRDEIKKLLQSQDLKTFIPFIESKAKEYSVIENLREEFNWNREIRSNQLGNVQKDKTVGKGENKKLVKAVRVPLSFQNYLVEFATAFEVGAPVTINSDNSNDISEAITSLWDENRINAEIVKMVSERKSFLQSAMIFSIKDIDKTRDFVKSSGINKNKDIKTRILKNKEGLMIPVFDNTGDMTLFCWKFKVKESNKKENTYLWVYEDRHLYKFRETKEEWILQSKDLHGFDCIPVVYTDQEHPEWKKSEPIIDRYEVAISKLGASNDYAGHPILKLYGTVEGAPDKDEDGKAFRLEQKETDDGKVVSSDVEFLTYDNAPEAVKLELEELKKLLFMFSSAVDLSLDNLKGLGTTSGFAIQLMFLAPIIKAQTTNTLINKPMIDRIINIFLSGIVTTLKKDLKLEAEKTTFDIKFNSILPSDTKETIETLAKAVNSKIASIYTAVKEVGLVDDINEEMKRIEDRKYSEENFDD